MDLSSFTNGSLNVKKTDKYDSMKNLEFNDYTMQVGEADKEEEYNVAGETNNVHWGQLKLFLGEMIFLSTYLKDIDIVIYVGSAPGDHIPVIVKLFPNVIYHLYDRVNFNKKLKTMDNVTIYNKYFTDDDIKMYNDLNKRYLFISDIRNLCHGDDSLEKCEDMIIEDMKLQASWVNKLKFKHGFLKFRLPFPIKYILNKYGEEFEYLDGILLKQAYPGEHSTECRLIVDGSNIRCRNWDLKKHERKMFYHNKFTRQIATYKNLISNDEEMMYPGKVFKRGKVSFMLDRKFDSMYFSTAIIKYMLKYNIGINKDNFIKMCDYIIDNIRS